MMPTQFPPQPDYKALAMLNGASYIQQLTRYTFWIFVIVWATFKILPHIDLWVAAITTGLK